MANANHIRFDRRDILVHAHARARVIMEGRDRPAQGYALDRERGAFFPSFPYSHALSLGLKIEWADIKSQIGCATAQPIISPEDQVKIKDLLGQWDSYPIRPHYTPDRERLAANITALTWRR